MPAVEIAVETEEEVVELLAVVDFPATRLLNGCSAGGGMVTVVLLIMSCIGDYFFLSALFDCVFTCMFFLISV